MGILPVPSNQGVLAVVAGNGLPVCLCCKAMVTAANRTVPPKEYRTGVAGIGDV